MTRLGTIAELPSASYCANCGGRFEVFDVRRYCDRCSCPARVRTPGDVPRVKRAYRKAVARLRAEGLWPEVEAEFVAAFGAGLTDGDVIEVDRLGPAVVEVRAGEVVVVDPGNVPNPPSAI